MDLSIGYDVQELNYIIIVYLWEKSCWEPNRISNIFCGFFYLLYIRDTETMDQVLYLLKTYAVLDLSGIELDLHRMWLIFFFVVVFSAASCFFPSKFILTGVNIVTWQLLWKLYNEYTIKRKWLQVRGKGLLCL